MGEKYKQVNRDELEQIVGERLPEKTAMSLINANVAVPVNAAVAANVLSSDSNASADANQTGDVNQFAGDV
jgi:hypothetical protein